MKKLINVLNVVLVIMIFAASCVLKDDGNNSSPIEEPIEDGYVMLDVNVGGGSESQQVMTKAVDPNVVSNSEVDIKKIRLFIFNNAGTATAPDFKFEKTELFTGAAITTLGTGEYKVKVKVKEGANKKIYALVNEPDGFTPPTGVTVASLKNMSFSLPGFFNGTAIGTNVENGIFMSGFHTGMNDFKYLLPASGESAEFAAFNYQNKINTVTINLKRNVARVDIYLNRKSDVAPVQFNAKDATGPSRIKVRNYTKGFYFSSINYEKANVDVFAGGGKTVQQDIVDGGTNVTIAGSQWTKLCHFYTPATAKKANASDASEDYFNIVLENIHIMKDGQIYAYKQYTLPNLLDKITGNTFEANEIYKLYCTINNNEADLDVVIKYENWAVWEGRYDI